MIIIGIIVSVIGALLIVAFAISRARCRMRVEATVKSLAVKKMHFRGRTVRNITPVFSYTVDGKEYTYKPEMSTTRQNRFQVGQKEFIFVNAQSPDEARYGSNLGFLLFGLALLLCGFFVLVLALWF